MEVSRENFSLRRAAERALSAAELRRSHLSGFNKICLFTFIVVHYELLIVSCNLF